MISKMTFLMLLLISSTTLATEVEEDTLTPLWQCDEGYTEVLWCELASGPHDFSRLSYCSKPNPENPQYTLVNLVIIRETSDGDYIRDSTQFSEVKEEVNNGQKRTVFYFDGQMTKKDVSENKWTGNYIKYGFTPRSATEDDSFTHRLYGTHHTISAVKKANGNWSSYDVGAAVGEIANSPNLVNCHRPQ